MNERLIKDINQLHLNTILTALATTFGYKATNTAWLDVSHGLDLREKVMRDILKERNRQDKLWGGNEHDDIHNSVEWFSMIIQRLGKAMAAIDGSLDYISYDDYRRYLVNAAALTIAQIETHDRSMAVHHFHR